VLAWTALKARPRVKIRIGVKTMPGDGSPGRDRLEGGPAAEAAVRQSHLKICARVASTNALAVPSNATHEASPMQKAWKEEIPLCAPPVTRHQAP
jgi:hypothetical protein